MREFTGKTNGKMVKGIYTNSGMPNQKPKRARKAEEYTATTKQVVKVNINMLGFGAAFMTFFYVPVGTAWKFALAALFILSAIHTEVKNNE